MNDIDKSKLGDKLRSERTRRGYSLDNASILTGVSKAMLGQIERGESSPTLSTLWKISSGLRVPIASFLTPIQSRDYQVTKVKDVDMVSEYDGGISVRNLFTFDPVTALDFLYIEIEPHTFYQSIGHDSVIEEYVYIVSGNLNMQVAGRIYPMSSSDSMNFSGTEKHAYENISDEKTIFLTILRY